MYIEGELFRSDYYYLWMSFQALGKLKQRFATASAKHIWMNLTLVTKLPNPGVFLKYLKRFDERKHLKTV